MGRPSLRMLQATRRDILEIVNGDGVLKNRFDLGVPTDGQETEAIRASHGHCVNIGVGGSALPVLREVELVTHGRDPHPHPTATTRPQFCDVYHPNMSGQDDARIYTPGYSLKKINKISVGC